MPKEILYHPDTSGSANYVIDARCPEHRYRPLKFDELFAVRTPDTVELNLHCPICEYKHKITLSTAS